MPRSASPSTSAWTAAASNARSAFLRKSPVRFPGKDNLMKFDPAEDLVKGQAYEVEVGDGARSVFGKPLSSAFRQTVVVLDYPEVAAAVPADKTSTSVADGDGHRSTIRSAR